MKKKVLLISTATVSLLFGVAAVSTLPTFNEIARGGDLYKITLDSTADVTVQDGCYHQKVVKNNKFDMVGWSNEGGAFGSIRKSTYGDYVYNGMIYNRSLINGFKTFKVDYDHTDGTLYYLFTDFLMEDMDFDGASLPDNTEIGVYDHQAYFLIYNTSDTPIDIESIEIQYLCDGSIDGSMIYSKEEIQTAGLGGARSNAKSYVLEDNYIEIENNPQSWNNNYSLGKKEETGRDNDDSWYRWNGKFLRRSKDLGNEFTFAMTIMGDYSRMIDSTKLFHYNVWPQFSYGNAADEPWVQTYIGNDNYEPRGHDNAFDPKGDRSYLSETYSGRFFTNYGWYNDAWEFADPDIVKIPDTRPENDLTMREAYERYNLPFWFIKFHVYLDGDNDPWVDIEINNMLIYSTYIFSEYDTVNTPDIYITTLPMHTVNYGIVEEVADELVYVGPDTSYKGYFTYPRLIA